jgi:hypothetical protein
MTPNSYLSRLISASLVLSLIAPYAAVAGVTPKGEFIPQFNAGVQENVKRVFLIDRDKYRLTDEVVRGVRSGSIPSVELRFHEEAQVTNSTALYFEVILNLPEDQTRKSYHGISLGDPLVRDFQAEVAGLNGKPELKSGKVHSYPLCGNNFSITDKDGTTVEYRKGLRYADYSASALALNFDHVDMFDMLVAGKDLAKKDPLSKRKWGSKAIYFREAGTLIVTAGSVYAAWYWINKIAKSKRVFEEGKHLNNIAAIAAGLSRDLKKVHASEAPGASFVKFAWYMTYFGLAYGFWRYLNGKVDSFMFGAKEAELDFLNTVLTESQILALEGDPFEQTFSDIEKTDEMLKNYQSGGMKAVTDAAARDEEAPQDEQVVAPTIVEATTSDVQPVKASLPYTAAAFKRFCTDYFEPYHIGLNDRLEKRKQRIRNNHEQKRSQSTVNP